MSTTTRLTKALADAIPQGPHPNPYAEWIPVRLDFALEAIDHMDWLEKGSAEWRSVAQAKAQHLAAVQATARIAIGHLQAVLNQSRTFDEQQAADSAARDWLISIGSEPQ